MIPQAVKDEAKLLLRGIVGAAVIGALVGIAHFLGINLPSSIALPSMALGGYSAIKAFV